ncbi:YqhR family membrane protein [Brevibacillus borstelensis]|uniref:YqhR family membrane protein n=1 Tax=Brevibacillus borstelensis TaxID=45462 RepID=UPI0030BB99C8
MGLTKTRGYLRGRLTQEKRTARADERGKAKALPFAKLVEIAFWGTIIWGIFRLAAHFLNFTPYGLGSYARPFLTEGDEESWPATVLGTIMLFFESLIGVFIYSVLFKRSRMWWSGLLYGLILLVVAGFFFRMGNWEVATLSTEAAWFLSLGMFVGMTITLEAYDEA